VELNALWYTALCIGQRLAHRFGDEENQAHWKALSHHVLHNFASAFWNETGGYLCDCIRPDGTQDKTLRPNQLLAVSLRRCLPQETPPLLNPWQERNLVMVCERRLRAGAGMRTLPPDHPDYHGQYIGALAERDAAYHQGTAWGWLTGEFLIAHSYAFGDSEAERLALRRLIHPVLESMRTGGINGIAEIFDGDDPYTSRGCFNQAWSVGTVLAAWRRLPGLEKGAVKRSKLD
jgi:glycogen debranching enzyme